MENKKSSNTPKYKKTINAMLNDSAAIMSSYIYWKKNKNLNGSIEFICEKFPFGGDSLIIAGIDEIVNLLFEENFKFTSSDVDFLKRKFPFEEGFFDFLLNLNLDDLVVYGYDNGDLVKSSGDLNSGKPILILTGPLVKLKLLTFPLNNLLSFSTLVATNSVRMKLAAGENLILLEFGLRRAQGPLAGIFASKYCCLSMDSVSNVLSGFYYRLQVKGTCAHAYIMSYQGSQYKKEFNNTQSMSPADKLFQKCLKIREDFKWTNTNLDELYAFVNFASVYKDSSNMLVDTYNTIESGVKNTIIVALALNEINFKISGIRLDSGDLADLSKKARSLFNSVSVQTGVKSIAEIKISASNDINEKSLNEFNRKGHAMDIYGIGTNLVTCQLQPFMEFKILTSLKSETNNLKLLFENKSGYNEKIFSNSKKNCLKNFVKLVNP